MFLSKSTKNNVYPCKPQFYCIKVGFKATKLYKQVFVMPGSEFCPYTVGIFSDEVWCAEKQTERQAVSLGEIGNISTERP